MTEERESQMEPIRLQFISPVSLEPYLHVSGTIAANDLPGIKDAVWQWHTIATSILNYEEIAINFRDEANSISCDLFQIHKALVHVAGGGEPVAMIYESEFDSHERARLIRSLDETEAEPAPGALAAIAATIMDECDGQGKGDEKPEPSQDDDEPDEPESEEDEFDSVIRFARTPCGAQILDILGDMRGRLKALEASANPKPDNGPSNYQVPEHEKAPAANG